MVFEKLKSFRSQVLKDGRKTSILTNKVMCICCKMVLESWYNLCKPFKNEMQTFS